MASPNRSFSFSRSSVSRGFFQPDEIRFELRQAESDALAGTFVITGRNAEWISSDGRSAFRIRRSFWTNRWTYTGQGEGREYARISFGFFSKRISFAEGGVYTMKMRRGGLLFPKRKYALLAEFFQEEDLKMTIMNTRRRKIFEADVRRPMAGTIESSLPGMAEIWGGLLLFQTYLHMQRLAVAAS